MFQPKMTFRPRSISGRGEFLPLTFRPVDELISINFVIQKLETLLTDIYSIPHRDCQKPSSTYASMPIQSNVAYEKCDSKSQRLECASNKPALTRGERSLHYSVKLSLFNSSVVIKYS